MNLKPFLLSVMILSGLLTACGPRPERSGYADYIIFRESNIQTVAYVTEEYKDSQLARMNHVGTAPFIKLFHGYVEVAFPEHGHLKKFSIPSESLIKIQWRD